MKLVTILALVFAVSAAFATNDHKDHKTEKKHPAARTHANTKGAHAAAPKAGAHTDKTGGEAPTDADAHQEE